MLNVTNIHCPIYSLSKNHTQLNDNTMQMGLRVYTLSPPSLHSVTFLASNRNQHDLMRKVD